MKNFLQFYDFVDTIKLAMAQQGSLYSEKGCADEFDQELIYFEEISW